MRNFWLVFIGLITNVSFILFIALKENASSLHLEWWFWVVFLIIELPMIFLVSQKWKKENQPTQDDSSNFNSEDSLWIEIQENSAYSLNPELHQNHILEQYKLYVEMADRISSRRNLANVFFLTLNTTILAAVGFSLEKIQLVEPKWLTIFPILGIESMVVVWWWLITSYRKLNTAKYKVVGNLEKRLPSSPYWSAEWMELGEGKDLKKYLPLTSLEKYVPIIFGFFYLVLSIYIIFIMK